MARSKNPEAEQQPAPETPEVERPFPVLGYLLLNVLFWGFCLAQVLVIRWWLGDSQGIIFFVFLLAVGFSVVSMTSAIYEHPSLVRGEEVKRLLGPLISLIGLIASFVRANRRRIAVGLGLVLAAGGTYGLIMYVRQLANRPFCIVALPDTQHYSDTDPEIFLGQTQWIREYRRKLRIICVVHEGDVTEKNSEREWQNADKAMSVLDGVVPYCLNVGNHDQGEDGLSQDRNTALFDRFFSVERFRDKPWYGGHMGDSIKNAYYYIQASGLKFLVVCLEFGPRDEVLQWANEVVANHGDHQVIVVTHNYMYYDNTRSGRGDLWTPSSYGCVGNDGEQMWEKFVSRHRNIFLVLSGHVLKSGTGRQTSTGVHGNKVYEVLANYQTHPMGGNGWLRIVRFVPLENRIYVRTYSPWLEEYADDGQNQFVLDYPMR